MFFYDENEQTPEEIALDKAVLREAQELELLDEQGNEILHERRKGNYSTEIKKVKVTKTQKLNRLTQRTAILIGKNTGDSDYMNWQKHRKLADKFRKKMEKKFHAKAVAKAKQIAKGAGSGPSSASSASKKSSDLPKSGART